jgi:hypothetical protein
MVARATAPAPLTVAMKTSFAQRNTWISGGVSTITPDTGKASANACPFADEADPIRLAEHDRPFHSGVADVARHRDRTDDPGDCRSVFGNSAVRRSLVIGYVVAGARRQRVRGTMLMLDH